MTALYFIGKDAGYDKGLQAGYNEADDEIEAAKWRASSEGRKVKYFYYNSGKEMIFECKGGVGWKIIKRRCYPYP